MVLKGVLFPRLQPLGEWGAGVLVRGADGSEGHDGLKRLLLLQRPLKTGVASSVQRNLLRAEK